MEAYACPYNLRIGGKTYVQRKCPFLRIYNRLDQTRDKRSWISHARKQGRGIPERRRSIPARWEKNASLPVPMMGREEGVWQQGTTPTSPAGKGVSRTSNRRIRVGQMRDVLGSAWRMELSLRRSTRNQSQWLDRNAAPSRRGVADIRQATATRDIAQSVRVA